MRRALAVEPTVQRKRGRPPLGSSATSSNKIIAQTVHTLASWGYSIRTDAKPGAAEVVGLLAVRVLGRASSQGGPLSERQVKRIYEDWLGDPVARRAHSSAHYPVAWRRRWRPAPDASIEQVAEKLLRNGGIWPKDAVSITGWAALAVQRSMSAWCSGRPQMFIPESSSGEWAEEDSSPTLKLAAVPGKGWKTGIGGVEQDEKQ
jgi:hypothetical protein